MVDKTCTKCKTTCDSCNFSKAKNSKDGLRSICKNCDLAYYKATKESKKVKKAAYQKEYTKKNRDKLITYHRNWYDKNLKDKGANSDNPEYYKHYRDMVNKTQALRLKTDMAFKIKRNVGRMMKNFFDKKRKTYEIVGCDQDLFHDWILWQAELDDIDINNYGKEYHIDHVVPCASFKLTDEDQQKVCFNWSNMRPLLASENIIKGDAIDLRVIKKQEVRKLCYLIKNKHLGNIDMTNTIRIDKFSLPSHISDNM